MSDTFYTFSEVIKELGITSNELNELMASGQLNPVRHEGRLKFKKSDLAKLLKKEEPPQLDMHKSNTPKQFYTWDEALTKLQIEKDELQRFIDDGDLQAFREKDGLKFSVDEIDNFVSSIMDQGTIVVQGAGLVEVVEDEPVMQLSIPSLENFNKPPVIPTIPSYSLDESLRQLQIEEHVLRGLVEDGEIQTVNNQGEVCYSKEDIDNRRKHLQVEATIVMPQQGLVEVEEDDESVEPIVISASYSVTETPIQQQKIQNSFNDQLAKLFSYEEALRELEISENEFNAMIYNNEIEVIHLGDNVQRFKKEDIAKIAKNKYVQPMVISPEDDDDDIAEGEPIDDGRKVLTKSFYTLSEATEHLGVGAQELLTMVEKNNIKTYRMNKLKNIKRMDLIKLSSLLLIENDNFTETLNKVEKKPKSPVEKNVAFSSIPPIPKKETKIEKKKALDNTIVLPLVDFEEEENDQAILVTSPEETKPSIDEVYKNYAPPSKKVKDTSLYYTFDEAINILQVEKEDLANLIKEGKLNCFIINGIKSLKKDDVTEYKRNKMVEPTIMMDDSGDDVLEEDDDIFFIS